MVNSTREGQRGADSERGANLGCTLPEHQSSRQIRFAELTGHSVSSGVQDTLLAEAADQAPTIERFRDGKAEHNSSSLAALLGIPEINVRGAIKPLIEMGFLEEIGSSYKVPMLYREGLEITQGKAFSSEAPADEEES